MFYSARWYDPALGRFAQADSVIPEQSQGVQAWDRYAYATNNPIKYIDPSGHDGCDPTDAQCVENDLGITFEGGFTDAELTIIVEAAYKMSGSMGGTGDFKKELGGVKIIKDDIDVGGYGSENKVQLNKNGGWDDWTVVHELAHSWDAANNWDLSEGLEKDTGGRTSWWQGIKVRFGFSGCGDFQSSGCNNDGYYYGDIPAKGADRNFNRREDFAESVATYVLGQDRAKKFINSYYPNVAYLQYNDYTQTSRWKYVDKLMAR